MREETKERESETGNMGRGEGSCEVCITGKWQGCDTTQELRLSGCDMKTETEGWVRRKTREVKSKE